MTQQININEIIENLPIVNPSRQYWLVRTESGDYYEEFRDKNYIAIGWNEIPLSDISSMNADPTNEGLLIRIKNKLIDNDDFDTERGKKSSQSKAIAQLLKFTYELKRGDIVVIPSSNSDYLSFGEILETPVFVEYGGICPFAKRKRVLWIKKDIRRLSLDSNLYRFIYAHQTINNVTEYSEYINTTLFDFYTINGRASLVLRVRKNDDFDSFGIGTLYSDLLYFMKEFSIYNGEEIKSGDINVKFDLQSPGTIIFFGIVVAALICLGVMTILSGGEGNFEIDPANQKIKFNFKSNSFLEKLSVFLNEKQDRKVRMIRLMEGLRHFEVEQNKNLGEIMEPSREALNENSSDDIKDGSEV